MYILGEYLKPPLVCYKAKSVHFKRFGDALVFASDIFVQRKIGTGIGKEGQTQMCSYPKGCCEL